MKNQRSLQLNTALLERKYISSDKPPPDSLFWKLWEANVDVAQKALNTKFIQGIHKGNLDPIVFGAFNVNDAYYCFKGAEGYFVAMHKAKDNDLKAFLKQKFESYTEYNETFPKVWRIKGGDSIIPTTVCKNYAAFEAETIKRHSPIYALIVQLPCNYLWAWLGEQLSPARETNLYHTWISNNNDPRSSYVIGNFIEAYCKEHQIDEDLAMELYSKAMQYEYLNFAAAFNSQVE